MNPFRCLLSAALIAASCIGCDAPAPPKPEKKTPRIPAPKIDTPPPPKKLAPLTFTGVDHAIQVLTTSSEQSQQKQAVAWLSLKGNAAAAPLAKIVKDTSVAPPTRARATTPLAQIGGPEAKSAFMQLLEDDNSLLRRKAITLLGKIKPTDKSIVNKLIELVQTKDDTVRIEAMMSLKNIGKPANAAEDVLLAILNSKTESDGVRDAAKLALKEVDERHQFTD